MIRLRRFLLAFLLAAGSAVHAWAAEPVVLQLKWKHQFQFAGYYMAQEKGYFKAAGLDVEIREAGDSTNPITEVLRQQAQFGIAGAELAMLRAQGQSVVAVASIIQHSPLTLITRNDIDSIQDLAGKRVMLLSFETELFAYFKREGLTTAQIQALPHSLDINDLVKGKVDAISGYSSDEPFDLKALNFPFKQFSPRSAGIDFYGDTLFTSDEYLRQNPDTVAAFRNASLMGWHYALAHVDETVDLILSRYGHRHSRTHLLNEATEIRRLMYPDLVEIGHMSPERWQQILEVYTELGLVSRGSDIQGLLYDPHPPIIPPWLARSLVMSILLLAVLSFLTWRFLYLSRRLSRTLKERDLALFEQNLGAQRLRTLLDHAPVAVIAWAEGFRITEWNQAAEHTFGWRAAEALGQNLITLLFAEQEQSTGPQRIEQSLRSNSRELGTFNNITRDGKPLLCTWSNNPCCDDKGCSLGVISIVQDITEQTRIHQALSESERRYRTLLEIAPFPVIVIRTADGALVYCNRRAADRFGLESNNLEGLRAERFMEHPEQKDGFIAQIIEQGVLFDLELELRTLKGETFWAHLSAILMARPDNATEIFVSFHDINQRKHSELNLHQANMDLQLQLMEIQDLQQQLQEQAIRDSLTGLYNRRYLSETLEREVARARRDGAPLALVIIDLDHFKQLNDSHGHRAGDRVLKLFAQLLLGDTRTEDLACRYGGEEFLVMLPGMGMDKALERAEIWRRSFAEQRLILGEDTHTVTASFGVAVFPEHGRDPDHLIHAADTALYVAKRSGRNRVEPASSTTEEHSC